MTYPISEIEGLTAYSASKLKSQGIRTTAALLEAARTVKGRKALAVKTGIPEQQLLADAGFRRERFAPLDRPRRLKQPVGGANTKRLQFCRGEGCQAIYLGDWICHDTQFENLLQAN